MKQEQEKILCLLKEFVRICDKYKLKYYLVCGSALGAVKYRGFIPWDDDIDVAMFRKEYEFFCKVAQTELPASLFLQNYETDPYFPAIYSKLRDSNTTCIETSVASLPINHGLCIDIFPLDAYPDRKLDQYRLEIKKKIYRYWLSIPCVRPEEWKERIVRPLRFIRRGKNTSSIARRYTRCVSRYDMNDSAIIANHGNWQGKLDYNYKEVFGEGHDAVFENIKVKIPSQYDQYLRQKYGDYKKDPPADKQKSHHRYLYMDANNPFYMYIKKQNKGGKCH